MTDRDDGSRAALVEDIKCLTCMESLTQSNVDSCASGDACPFYRYRSQFSPLAGETEAVPNPDLVFYLRRQSDLLEQAGHDIAADYMRQAKSEIVRLLVLCLEKDKLNVAAIADRNRADTAPAPVEGLPEEPQATHYAPDKSGSWFYWHKAIDYVSLRTAATSQIESLRDDVKAMTEHYNTAAAAATQAEHDRDEWKQKAVVMARAVLAWNRPSDDNVEERYQSIVIAREIGGRPE